MADSGWPRAASRHPSSKATPMAAFAGDWVFDMEVDGAERRYLGPDVVGAGTEWRPRRHEPVRACGPGSATSSIPTAFWVGPGRQLTGGFFSLAGRSVADIVGGGRARVRRDRAPPRSVGAGSRGGGQLARCEGPSGPSWWRPRSRRRAVAAAYGRCTTRSALRGSHSSRTPTKQLARCRSPWADRPDPRPRRSSCRGRDLTRSWELAASRTPCGHVAASSRAHALQHALRCRATR